MDNSKKNTPSKTHKLKCTFVIVSFFIQTLSLPLTLALLLSGWKKRVIHQNLAHTQLEGRLSFFQYYFHLSCDLVSFLLSITKKPVQLRQKDLLKFNQFKNSGGLLLTAHFHNWELMGSWLVSRGLPLKGSALPLKSSFWNSVLLFLRKKNTLPTISIGVARGAYQWIKKGNVFGVLADQRPKAIFVNSSFFGHTVKTTALPGFLLQKTACPVYFLWLTPSFEVRAIRLTTGTTSETLLLKRYHKVLETIIRKHPNYWYGFSHNRFKV